MSYGYAEQICKRCYKRGLTKSSVSAYHGYVKKASHRRRRQQERVDLEGAMTKTRYFGYDD